MTRLKMMMEAEKLANITIEETATLERNEYITLLDIEQLKAITELAICFLEKATETLKARDV